MELPAKTFGLQTSETITTTAGQAPSRGVLRPALSRGRQSVSKRRRSPAGRGKKREVQQGDGLHLRRRLKYGPDARSNNRYRWRRIHLAFSKQAKEAVTRSRFPALMQGLMELAVGRQHLENQKYRNQPTGEDPGSGNKPFELAARHYSVIQARLRLARKRDRRLSRGCFGPG